MADQEDIRLALEAVRDAVAGIRAVALLLTGAHRDEVDQTALLVMIAQVCEHCDRALEVATEGSRQDG